MEEPQALESDGTVAPDAPPEVEHDALAELDRIHQAQKFDPSATGYDASYGISSPALSYEEPVPTAPDPVAQSAPTPRELKSLEDLYSSFPKMGDGQFHIRVVRKHPSTYSGVRVAGFLEDVFERLTMSDFAARFGGHSYEVSMRGPSRTSAIDAEGREEVRTLRTIRVEVPGAPLMLGPTSGNGGDGMSMSGMGIRDNPQVAIKRLEIEQDNARRREARDARWQEQLTSRPSGISPALLEAIESAADKRAGEVRDDAATTISDLRERIRRDYEALQAKDQQVQSLREQMVTVQTEYATKWRDEESRQVRELKDRQESEIRRTKEDQSLTVQRITDENKRLTAEMGERTTRERETIQKQEKIERDRMREDAMRRERQLIDDSRTREENMRQNYESRLTELQRSLEREVRSVKEQRDREVLSVQNTESTKAVLAEKTAHIQVETMRGEIVRMNEETDGVRRENEHLRMQNNKTPEEAIEQAHRLASITGFGGGGKEEELDWKRGVVSAVKNLIDKAPEIAEGLGKARETNRVAASRAQQQARASQHRAQISRDRSLLAHQAQSQHAHRQLQHEQSLDTESAPTMTAPPRRVPRPPPPGVGRGWGSGPATNFQGGGLPPTPHGPPPSDLADPEISHHFGSPAPAQPPGPPLQEDAPDALSPESFGATEPPPSLGVSPSAHNYAPSEPLDSESFVDASDNEGAFSETEVAETTEEPQEKEGNVAITEEMIASFTQKLDDSISSGLVTPAEFARGFISEVGAETTWRIISSMDADQLVDAVLAHEEAAGTAIVTRDGRKFVQQLWSEAASLVQESVAQ